MVSRYICSIIEEARIAIQKLRIDMLPGLLEEMQVAANRMEAKLSEYNNLGYELSRYKALKAEVKRLKATKDFIEANLDLEEVDVDEEERWPDDL